MKTTEVALVVQENNSREINVKIKEWKNIEILTVKDIKLSLGCGINRAYDIVNQKDFPKIKIGQRIYIPKEEYEKWLKMYLRKEYNI